MGVWLDALQLLLVINTTTTCSHYLSFALHVLFNRVAMAGYFMPLKYSSLPLLG